VPERVRKQRADRLLSMSRQKRAAFAHAQAGIVRSVLLEERLENGDWVGTSDNYLKVRLVNDPSRNEPSLTGAITPGRHYPVRLHPLQETEGMVDLQGQFLSEI
jgi:tRNA A37 methylthiotransferase MiaB